MSKIRHTLQLLQAGALSTRQIGAALGISKSTVSEIGSHLVGQDCFLQVVAGRSNMSKISYIFLRCCLS